MSNGNVPNKESNRPSGDTELKTPFFSIKGPIGRIGMLLIGLVVAYLAVLVLVIPKHAPILADPLIQAVLTAQPTQMPRPHLVVKGKTIQNKQICVGLKETVRLEIEPQLGDPGAKYTWVSAGAELISTDDWEKEFVSPDSAGKLITVQVCEKDPNTGACGQAIDFMIFTVQEVCPK